MELASDNNKELIGKVGELYGIGKSTVYNRFQLLGIIASKENGKTFLTSNDLSLLDQLHDWIEAGNSMESFQKPGALVQAEEAEIDIDPAAAPEININFEEAAEGNQINQLIRVAQEQAAGLLMAQNYLAAQFKDNPHLLPDDLKSQVKATEEAIAPKSINPKQYAMSLVNKYAQMASA